MPALSENVSLKPKRGRPRRFSEAMERMYTTVGIGLDCHTRRGKLNRWHGQTALYELKDEPGLDWLFNCAQMRAGTGKVRWTILGELGRLQDPDLIRSMAHEICELKPGAAEAVGLIREHRIGRVPVSSVPKLTDALLRTLNDYKAAHSWTSYRMVRDALRQAHEAVGLAESKAKARKKKG